jgi:hypothetical protein
MLTEILRQTLDAPPKKCLVGQWVEEQAPEDQNLLIQVFASSKVVMSDLHKKLVEQAGVTFGVTSFKAHIKGSCVCPKV